MTKDLEELKAEFDSLESCCLHEPQWRPQDAARVIMWKCESPEGYGSTDQVILVELKGEMGYGLLTSSSDTTGHGCQCGAQTTRSDTLRSLVGRLTEWELKDLFGRV